jgi:hypothetical protein
MGRLLQSVNEHKVVAIVVERDKDACSWIRTDGPEMTPNQAIAFVREHGVVLESGRGPVPSLAEAVAQGPLKGSWWSHPPTGRHIVRTVPYPDWVSAEASRLALELSESEAIAQVGTWLT